MISRSVAELIRLVRKLDVAAHQGPSHVERELWGKIRALLRDVPVEPEPKVEEKIEGFVPSAFEVKESK